MPKSIVGQQTVEHERSFATNFYVARTSILVATVWKYKDGRETTIQLCNTDVSVTNAINFLTVLQSAINFAKDQNNA
jgi:hypothetical protein